MVAPLSRKKTWRIAGICLYLLFYNNYGSRYEVILFRISLPIVWKAAFDLWKRRNRILKTQRTTVVPWVFLDWCPSPYRWGIPRRSCDSSQQADWVGLIRTHGSTFVQRARSLCCKKAGGCAIVRIFFRETGMPVHTGISDAISVASPYYGWIYQQASSVQLSEYGLATEGSCLSLSVPRVSFWNNTFQKLGLILKIRVAIRITYTQKKDWLTHAKN